MNGTDIIKIDYTKKRKGSLTDNGGEIDICPQCGRKGEHNPEGFASSGVKVFRGFYFHRGIEEPTTNTIHMTDLCEIPWSPEALEIVEMRARLGMDD